jgi:uncharacterized protein
MPLSTGRRAIDLALQRTTRRLHLVFFGGEPLCRWRTLTALTDYASGRGAAAGIEVRPTVTTNGTLLRPDRAAFLRNRGFVVAISCDGIPSVHDARRRDARGRGSHARTLRGLRTALAAQTRVRVVMVLHPDGVDDLPASVAFLAAEGAADLVLSPDWSADWTDSGLRRRWRAAYDAVADLYVAAFRAGRPFWISLIDDKIATHLKGGYQPAERCDLGRRNLVVSPRGRLYPCDRMVGEDRDDRFVVGDLETGPDPTRLAALRRGACTLPEGCRECAVLDRCRNRCACTNLALTGSIESPSETLCFHEQTAIEAADRAAERLWGERCEAFVRRHYGNGVG